MRSFARRIAAIAVRVAPAARREWIAAIAVEVEHAADAHDAALFALGGLSTALRLRLAEPAFAPVAVRWGLAVAALVWAGMNLVIAYRLDAAEASIGAALCFAAAAIYVVGAGVLAAGGLRMGLILMTPVLALWTAYAAGAATLLTGSPHRRIYQALALEEVAVLVVAVSLGVWSLRRGARAAPR